MKKHMLRKDFRMEIRKSMGRFISIFLIVALGVAFYSGIRSSEPSMRISGDSYFDHSRLMDIKVMGTLGLTEEDVDAIEDVEGIELAEGSYSKDVLCEAGDTQRVVHVMAMQKQFNDLQVSSGRLPRKEGECLVDEEFAAMTGYQVGDTIQLSSGDESPLSDSLTTDRFRIVGIGSSPLYISFGRGSSTIGNGEVSGFIAVDPASFCMDVYTEIYVRLENAERETSFTDAYDALSDAAVDALAGIEDERCNARREEITQEAEETLNESRQTVDEKSASLEQAKQELEDGKSRMALELEQARRELTEGQAQMDAARQKIEEGQAQLDAGRSELAAQQEKLDSAQAAYESGRTRTEQESRRLDEAQTQYLAQYQQLMPLIESGRAQIQAGKEQIASGQASLEQQETGLQAALAPMQETAEQLQTVRDLQTSLAEQMSQGDAEYNRIGGLPEEERTAEEQSFYDTWQETRNGLYMQQQDAEQAQQQILEGILDAYGTEEAFSSQLTELQEKKEQIQAAKEELEQQSQALDTKTQELEQQEQELLSAGKQIEDGKQQIAQAQQQLAESKQQIDAGQSQIDAARKLLDEKSAELEQGKAELTAGEQKIQDGWNEYEAGAAQAASQITSGQSQIEEGEQQLEEAKQEIADAQAEIDRIEKPEWFIQDRSSALPDYDGYGENADRMRAIGRVFPAVFFLVAALISLTAMTRMVEEQRIQIGTLKALGYSKVAIAAKYIAYAMTATLGGSVVGVLFGEKVFPWIIIYAYKIMYQHIPDILVPYHVSYALQATLIAVLCTLAATAFSCYRELASVPAQLMRPPAPKQGQRILLERVRPVWNHLNFSWKSSIRNLVRYKKRFFMTVFGIGGCMALMVVGFGLKDCIFVIPELQYSNIQKYDGAVYFDAGLSQDAKQDIADTVADDQAVDGELVVRMQNVEAAAGKESEEVYVTVPRNLDEVGEFLDFHSRTEPESYNLKEDQAILTEKAAEVLGVEPGDTITLEDTSSGTKEVTVGAVCENYMGHYLYLSPDYYKEVFGCEPEYNGVLFKIKDGKEDQIEEVGSKLLKNSNVLNISYTSSIEEQLDDMLRSLNLVIVVLIISAGMLAFIVLYNLNTINITERKRELATIKVLGFYDTEVAAYVYRENILLTLIGAAAGMVLGWVLLQFVIVTVEVDEVMFGRVIHAASYVYSFLFTIGFSMFVNWVMYFKLKKIDMVESLKSVE